MNDRELLEWAAKAAGVDCRIVEFGSLGTFKGCDQYDEIVFNPLYDDGDALRLAVKLHMFDSGPLMAFRLEETRKDPARDDCRIIRRAIVRAAAEIGKAMEG